MCLAETLLNWEACVVTEGNHEKYFYLASSTTIEFSLNEVLWIQQIQWIVTKSKSRMVTKDILYMTIDTFLDVVIKKNFRLLSTGWHLFRVVSGKRCLPRGSNENAIYMTSTGSVFVTRWVIPLVNIPLLDFVMIH